MKLLTLEEIERIAKLENQDAFTASEEFIDLIATARAYWEEKETYPYELPATEEVEDKPHAPTIRAIVEAMEKYNAPENFGKPLTISVLWLLLKSLEKHIE
jgi:hypothetical protein